MKAASVFLTCFSFQRVEVCVGEVPQEAVALLQLPANFGDCDTKGRGQSGQTSLDAATLGFHDTNQGGLIYATRDLIRNRLITEAASPRSWLTKSPRIPSMDTCALLFQLGVEL